LLVGAGKRKACALLTRRRRTQRAGRRMVWLDVFRGRRKLLLLLAADCNSTDTLRKNQEATAAAHQGVLPCPSCACCGGDPYGENEKGEGREKLDTNATAASRLGTV